MHSSWKFPEYIIDLKEICKNKNHCNDQIIGLFHFPVVFNH